MKKFEKWWDEFGMDYDHYAQQEAWEAALRWVLKNLEKQKEYEKLAPRDTGWEGRFIEQELKK